MAEIRLNCFSCNKEMSFIDRVGFREECSACGADAHACKNCRFYDRASYNECVETSADPVREKERSNFCDLFQVREGVFGSSAKPKVDHLAAAEALFKKKP